jgi:uncharacterized membrane protein YdjX (TVP38/TMEM64 family)
MKKLPWNKVVVILFVIACVALLFKNLPITTWMEKALTWIESLGIWGPIVFIVIYIIATVLLLPGSALTLGAGFLFDLVKGSIIVSIASTIGATLAMLLGRTLFREKIGGMVLQNPKFKAVDAAVGQNGFKIVGLTRLTPAIPFTLLNYMYSLTKVRVRDYLIASWLGMIPGTIMYVYIGSLFQNIEDVFGEREKRPSEYILLIVGFIVTMVITIIVTRIAKKAIRDVSPSLESTEKVPES